MYELIQFHLYDFLGQSVLCTAVGRHVDNPTLIECSEITIYFAVALSGATSTMPGQLWIYDDAHLVALRHGCTVPASRAQVLFRRA